MKRKPWRRQITLSERMIELDKESRPIEQATRIEKRGLSRQPLWLSGNPYLWSAFIDKAFVFADPAQAKALMKRFPQHFTGAKVRSEAILAAGVK